MANNGEPTINLLPWAMAATIQMPTQTGPIPAQIVFTQPSHILPHLALVIIPIT